MSEQDLFIAIVIIVIAALAFRAVSQTIIKIIIVAAAVSLIFGVTVDMQTLFGAAVQGIETFLENAAGAFQ